MARILYGAPESEREEDNTLVAKLREEHEVAYLNDWLGFAFELLRCKGKFFRKYELVFYDTRLYGEGWAPQVRAEHFKKTVLPYFETVQAPVNVIVDEEIADLVKDAVEDFQRRKEGK